MPAISFISLQAMLGPRSPTVQITFAGSFGPRQAPEPMPTVRLSVLPPSKVNWPMRSSVSSL